MSGSDPTDAPGIRAEDAALEAARRHLRNARRSLNQGFGREAMLALYEALLFGMRYHISRRQAPSMPVTGEDVDMSDPAALFHALPAAAIQDNPFVFNRLSRIVERALWQESFAVDTESIAAEVELLLERLGVVPADESVVPLDDQTRRDPSETKTFMLDGKEQDENPDTRP